jgi:hypothetical protein
MIWQKEERRGGGGGKESAISIYFLYEVHLFSLSHRFCPLFAPKRGRNACDTIPIDYDILLFLRNESGRALTIFN